MKFCLRDTAGSPERARWLHLARSGSQSQRAIWFILPAHGASHIIRGINAAYKNSYALSFFPSLASCHRITIPRHCTDMYICTFITELLRHISLNTNFPLAGIFKKCMASFLSVMIVMKLSKARPQKTKMKYVKMGYFGDIC